MRLKRKVDLLVRRYETRDPFKLAAALGYIVQRSSLKGIRGFYQNIHRCSIIYVDNNLSEADATFVCAHEIGQALMHRGCNRIFMDTHTHFQVNRYEIEADRFAINLLFDDDYFIEFYYYLGFPVQFIAECLHLSTELCEYRISTIAENDIYLYPARHNFILV